MILTSYLESRFLGLQVKVLCLCICVMVAEHLLMYTQRYPNSLCNLLINRTTTTTENNSLLTIYLFLSTLCSNNFHLPSWFKHEPIRIHFGQPPLRHRKWIIWT